MKIIPSILAILFLLSAGQVTGSAQNVTTDTVEPLLVSKALQDEDCRHWVDSVMNKLSFKEKVGQLFIYTIAPIDTKRNLELLCEAVDTYKVGGLLFSGGKMQTQVALTNRAQKTGESTCYDYLRRRMGVGDAFAWNTCFPEKYDIGMYP